MKKLIIALSAAAALTYTAQATAASPSHVAHKGHESQENRLRECITHCVPSTCRENKAVAAECTKLCAGHGTSLAKWLHKKCSMAAGDTGKSEVAYGVDADDASHGWTAGSDKGGHSSKSVAQQQWKSQSQGESMAQAQGSQQQSTWSPQQSSQPMAQAPQTQTTGTGPSDAQLAQAPREQTWTGAQDATLAQRTAGEAVSAERPYGVAETEMQLFGLDQEGHVMSHSTNHPAEDAGYARSEILG